MPTTYFIGGAPRSGKTTVIQELIKQKPMLAASTDAIRRVAKSLTSTQINPRLHKTDRGLFASEQYMKLLHENPAKLIDYEIDAAEETWKSVLDFISYYQGDGKYTALEGIAILPKGLAEVNFRYKAVFFIHLGDQTDAILAHAKANPSDWLHEYDDDTVRAFCASNQQHNQYFYDEATKYGLPVVLVGEDFQASVAEAVSSLLS